MRVNEKNLFFFMFLLIKIKAVVLSKKKAKFLIFSLKSLLDHHQTKPKIKIKILRILNDRNQKNHHRHGKNLLT